MHLKEDAMKNGQVKPAYNVQYSVDAGFVTWVTVGPQTSDCTTLLPFLEDFRKHFPFQYTRIIADSGYESEENYTKLAEQGYDAYIKPSDHEQRKTPFQKDIGKFQNMDYDAKNDVFYCHNHRKLTCVGKKTETIMGPLSRPRSKILRVAVSRIILSSEASKVKLVGNLVA